MSKFQKITLGCLGSVAAVLLFFAIVGGMYLFAKQNNPNFDQIGATATPKQANASEFVPISGKFWTGVKVYGGIEKEYLFDVVGGSEDCQTIPSGRGVFVRFPSGNEEWKDREYLAGQGIFFVRSDDPAIKKMEWFEYPGCP